MGGTELVIIIVIALLLFGPTAVLAWFAWTLYRAGGDAPKAKVAVDGDPALLEARRRYAAGEITKEQYEEIMRTLGS
ncbi:MAG: hypothetical protein C0418_02300 [Coriobacteriaceae bacterium]|nr:hypothetical protein [Coriobacteriaceae bacterium]